MTEIWKMISGNFLKVFLPMGALIGLCWAIYSAATHFVKLEDRIEKLEGQVKLIATAPNVLRWDSGNPKSNDGATPLAIPNPLIATCTDLYNRVLKASEIKEFTVQQSLNGYMRELGCAEVFKSTVR